MAQPEPECQGSDAHTRTGRPAPTECPPTKPPEDNVVVISPCQSVVPRPPSLPLPIGRAGASSHGLPPPAGSDGRPLAVFCRAAGSLQECRGAHHKPQPAPSLVLPPHPSAHPHRCQHPAAGLPLHWHLLAGNDTQGWGGQAGHICTAGDAALCSRENTPQAPKGGGKRFAAAPSRGGTHKKNETLHENCRNKRPEWGPASRSAAHGDPRGPQNLQNGARGLLCLHDNRLLPCSHVSTTADHAPHGSGTTASGAGSFLPPPLLRWPRGAPGGGAPGAVASWGVQRRLLKRTTPACAAWLGCP